MVPRPGGVPRCRYPLRPERDSLAPGREGVARAAGRGAGGGPPASTDLDLRAPDQLAPHGRDFDPDPLAMGEAAEHRG